MRTALVLVGGQGKRISELFPEMSKPLVPVAGKPLLDYLLESLKQHGFQNVFLLAGHRAEDYRKYTQLHYIKDLNIKLIAESTPLGSAGAVRAALVDIPEGEKQFLVCYGGTLFEGSLTPLLDTEIQQHDCVIGVSEQLEMGDYGCVKLNDQGVVSEFQDRQFGASGLVNTGFMVCSKNKILEMIPEPNKFYSFERDILPRAKNIKAINLHGRYYDISVPARYAELNADMCLQQAGQQNKALQALLAVTLDGGKCFVQQGELAKLLSTGLPEVVQIPIENLNEKRLGRATVRDLVIVNRASVDELFSLTQKCAAQIMYVGSAAIAEGLIDENVSEADFRSALMSFSGAWERLSHSYSLFQIKGGVRRPALFLDRDGIIIEDVGYVRRADSVKLIPGVEKLIDRAHSEQMSVVVVTNQSGLGRGIMTWSDYDRVNARMNQLLAENNCWVDRSVCAPFFTDSERAYGLVRRSLRKPRPGLFHQVKEDLGIDLARSVMIGDSATDLMAAALAGLGRAYLLNSSKATSELEKWRKWPLYSRVKWATEVGPIQDFQVVDLQKLVRGEK